MDIKEDEIKEIKTIGKMHDSDVKVVTLKGGFHIGMGKKNKTSNKSEILAVGSHPALVAHQISKKFNGKYEETMTKNASENMPAVTDYSHNLSSKDKNVLGLDIYAIQKNDQTEFKVTKHNFEIFSIQASQNNGEIVLEKTEKNESRLGNLDKNELAKNLEKSIKEYAQKHSLKIKKKF